jgi:hypothetical protein
MGKVIESWVLLSRRNRRKVEKADYTRLRRDVDDVIRRVNAAKALAREGMENAKQQVTFLRAATDKRIERTAALEALASTYVDAWHMQTGGFPRGKHPLISMDMVLEFPGEASTAPRAGADKKLSPKLAQPTFKKTPVPNEVVKRARVEFGAHLLRRRKRGQKVKVLKHPYHAGLSFVRAALLVNGIEVHIFFNNGRWCFSKALSPSSAPPPRWRP